MLDQYRFFVHACNKSRATRTLNLCVVSETDQFDRFPLTANICPNLAPFERVRTDIKLSIHLHLMAFREETEVPFPDNNFPCQELIDHIAWLQDHHEQDMAWEARPCLLTDRVRFRACLVRTLPCLQVPHQEQFYIYVLEAHQALLREVGYAYQQHSKDAIIDVWLAHDRRDREAFDLACRWLANPLELQSQQRGGMLRDGAEGLDGFETKSARLDHEARIGLYTNDEDRPDLPQFDSWAEYARNIEPGYDPTIKHEPNQVHKATRKRNVWKRLELVFWRDINLSGWDLRYAIRDLRQRTLRHTKSWVKRKSNEAAEIASSTKFWETLLEERDLAWRTR
jgi:hypothetical protein